jgi:hypothetical protein
MLPKSIVKKVLVSVQLTLCGPLKTVPLGGNTWSMITLALPPNEPLPDTLMGEMYAAPASVDIPTARAITVIAAT